MKEPFDIDRVMDGVREAVRPYPKAAMLELAERGFGSPFQQLIACILSIRTYDEVSLPAALTLLERAPDPAGIAALSVEEIDGLIRTVSFHEGKASQIQAIARSVAEEHGGELPCSFEALTGYKGVGPKCANLALGIACGQARISVDIHVHRVTNRWGYVATTTPEGTLAALEKVLPEPYWIEINALLVPFGKHICTGRAPKCSVCPVLSMCRQVGVTEHR
ncbi:MAG: endonuclease III domain-containing protein [Fimbriimonas sp.]